MALAGRKNSAHFWWVYVTKVSVEHSEQRRESTIEMLDKIRLTGTFVSKNFSCPGSGNDLPNLLLPFQLMTPYEIIGLYFIQVTVKAIPFF